jgi:hypothetical protein
MRYAYLGEKENCGEIIPKKSIKGEKMIFYKKSCKKLQGLRCKNLTEGQ